MTLYLDTSSVVKLYVAESGSDVVRTLVDAADLVATSAIAYPEARAALARRQRERTFGRGAYRKVLRALEEDWPRYLALVVSASVCREAGDLAERYHLRAYDAVHLASFLELVRRAGTSRVQFSSFDDRLNRAAARAMARLGRVERSKRR